RRAMYRFCLSCPADHRALHSFPTRRSSDLIMTVFLTGNRALVKASSKDSVLTHFIVEELHAIEPRAPIEFAEQLKNFDAVIATGDRKSTRLNSSHVKISYAVFCLKKKKKKT